LALYVAHAQERSPIFQQMFKTYGLESFGQVEKIRYTFHLELPGLNLVRSWEWEPKTDLIAYEGKDKDGAPVKVTYLRSQLSSQSDFVKNEIDPAFSNDNYWLLFVLTSPGTAAPQSPMRARKNCRWGTVPRSG
ncbi:MAG: hypothetical protein WCF62_31940, partial [Pseudolabrys sp.]